MSEVELTGFCLDCGASAVYSPDRRRSKHMQETNITSMSVILCPSCKAEIPQSFKFCGECGAKLQPVAPAGAQAATASPLPPSPATPPASSTPPRDELRDVTVLFADVTGFTAMSEKLDPEAVHELMNACFDGLGRIVHAHGGHIDKYIGDSIMALFGAPVAHEDDPLRAAETALEMQAFLFDFSAKQAARSGGAPAFRMRIGLNCGTVFAGAIGTEGRRDYSVLGDVVNVAARLESAAEPGTVLASAQFKARVQQLYTFGPARLLQLKGKTEAIEAYVIKGDRLAVERSDTASAEPFVARETELRRIREAMAGATPPWIEIRGPLGIGKSHLARMALSGLAGMQIVHVISRPATAARPFSLIRRILHALCILDPSVGATPQTREELINALSHVSSRLGPFLNALWYIAAPDALALRAPDPDALTFRQTLERGIAVLLSDLSRNDKPHALLLDAYDFADAETRKLLERGARRESEAFPPVVVTTRGEGATSANATHTLELRGLEPTESRELVRALTLAAPLPAEAEQDIVRRAGGVPLFIKELVRKVEEDLRHEDKRPGGKWSGAAAMLPSSLLGLMIARLDRLDDSLRSFLGHCSVQGAEFSPEIATRTWLLRGGEATEPAQLLSRLERQSLVTPTTERNGRWAFTEMLMQNACYDGMLRRDRRELHKLVAEVMIAEAEGEAGVSPEALAYHFESSEQWENAAHQNVRAGTRAAGIFANADALSRYARALTALEELAERSPVTRKTELAANRGAALIRLRIGDYAAAAAHAERMREIAVEALDRAESVRLLAHGVMHRGDLESASRMLAAAEQEIHGLTIADDPDCISARIAFDHADVCHRRGENGEARTLIDTCRRRCRGHQENLIQLDILAGRLARTEGRFEEASALYERAHMAAIEAGSLSEEALTSNYMGNAARDAGRYAVAETYFNRALEIWSRVGMTEAIAGAHNNLANLAISRGDDTSAAHHYGKALKAFEEIGNTAGRAIAKMNLAILDIECDRPTNAVQWAEAALTLLEPTANRVLIGLARVIRGEALIDMSRHADAKQAFLSVLTDYTEESHPLALAGARRGLGRIHVFEQDYAKAQEQLSAALTLFRRLKRVQEAARTEVYLAGAYDRTGNAVEARYHLSNARRTFEGLGAARDLLKTNRIELTSVSLNS